MSQTIEIESIHRLDIKPGERFLVRIPARTTAEHRLRLVEAFGQVFPDHRVLLVSDDIEISVVPAA
jgi:hypothetical protein